MIFGYSVFNYLEIYDTNRGVFESDYEIVKRKADIEKSIVVDNMDTFVLSLCMHNAIVLLEEINARYYTKNEILENDEKNYIIVNAVAKGLLKEMVGEE